MARLANLALLQFCSRCKDNNLSKSPCSALLLEGGRDGLLRELEARINYQCVPAFLGL